MNLPALLGLSHSVMLAPLSGISSLPFRRINRQFGCKCAFLEMIHAHSLCYQSKKTIESLQSDPKDRPLGVQLLSNKQEFLRAALEKLSDYNFDLLDFNAACPQKKVTSKGEGAALLKDLNLLQSLLKIMVQHSPGVTVTVKVRLGWDSACGAYDIARCVQDAGVDGIFVHGRTKVQGYSGDIDYNAIRKMKKAIRIPLIASGNILNAGLAKKMFQETGCDGIIIARGSLGNPWIFREIEQFLKNGKIPARPKVDEIAEVMKRHFDLSIEHFGPSRSVGMFRKFYVWYTRGVKGVKYLRPKVMRVLTVQAMLDAIEEFRVKGKSGA